MGATVRIGRHEVGFGRPTFVIAEIGINHNGSLANAKRLIEGAAKAGADCVKFQKRTPEICVPPHQWEVERDTPWGRMTYIEYKHRIEFGQDEYEQIDAHCRDCGILWTASCWDEPSVDFLEQFDVPFYKAASASLTDVALLRKMQGTGKPLMISTGMSTMAQIRAAVAALRKDDLLVAHSTSTYPCPVEEVNLRMIHTLMIEFPDLPVGYSGHETGLAPSQGAVALGACFVERHVTLDRAMWGSDQAASVELGGLAKLVANIRDTERALGDGVKRLYASELAPMSKLRRVDTLPVAEGEELEMPLAATLN